MKQIADAPWIREAQTSGLELAEDGTGELDSGACPMLPRWLWAGEVSDEED